MKKHGVIFDYNGTLVNDFKEQEGAWRECIKRVFKREITDDEFRLHVHGLSNSEILNYFARRTLSDDERAEYEDEKETIYRALCDSESSLNSLSSDVVRIFNELKENNIPFAIATASPLKNVEFYIKKYSLDRWFKRECIIYIDGTFPGKPEPDIYIRAMNALCVKAEDAIVFEDSFSGICAAKRAKVGKVIAVDLQNKREYYENIEGLYGVISSFDEFDRSLLALS